MTEVVNLPEGVYCDIRSCFLGRGDVPFDIESARAHLEWLQCYSVAGLVVMGINAQRSFLHPQTSKILTRAIVTLFSNSYHWRPIMVSTLGALNKEQAIEDCLHGRDNGASFALVAPPINCSHPTRVQELRHVIPEIISASPLPVIIQENLENSTPIDAWVELVQQWVRLDYVVGITCSKLTLDRLHYLTDPPHNLKLFGSMSCLDRRVPQRNPIHGVITGIPNFAPQVCILAYKHYRGQRHDLLSNTDPMALEEILAPYGLDGIKYATLCASLAGREDSPRREDERLIEDATTPVVEAERMLAEIDI